MHLPWALGKSLPLLMPDKRCNEQMLSRGDTLSYGPFKKAEGERKPPHNHR